ncbi:hypothetical protein V493_04257 [Pseudogymnoascus sp. VKM F-4281 (FW-2241)]|nr:hypothetical protein V493_04257 [Pseudogymnoascus sp. VKM F-4281 (FW-2241)]
MAVSRLSVSSALCLVIALFLAPTTAHKSRVTVFTTVTDCPSTTLSTATSSTSEPPDSCVTITSTTTPASCPTCPTIACIAIAKQVTQPCGCPSAVPTVLEPTGCCPDCIIPTYAVTATDC